MKKKAVGIFLLLVLVIVIFHVWPPAQKKKDVDGVLAGYVRTDAYTNPLAVVENHGTITYLAFFEHQTAAMDENGVPSSELLKDLLNGSVTGITVHVEAAEKGKTVSINGREETVWQAYQLYKTAD